MSGTCKDGPSTSGEDETKSGAVPDFPAQTPEKKRKRNSPDGADVEGEHLNKRTKVNQTCEQ